MSVKLSSYIYCTVVTHLAQQSTVLQAPKHSIACSLHLRYPQDLYSCCIKSYSSYCEIVCGNCKEGNTVTLEYKLNTTLAQHIN